MKNFLLVLALGVCAYGQTGLGKSTFTCLDKDGDGYGVGPGCLGPDADDTNVAAHTSADVISAYGSMNGFLVHIGYQNATTPATVWCISTTGSDATGASSTNADTACQKPFQDWLGVYGHLATPYIVLFRSGTYTQQLNPISGTASNQNVVMSYPGELATLDYSASTGNAINMIAKSYVTIDGLKILANPSGAGYSSGTYILYGTGSQTITAINNILTHCEISGAGTDSNVDADNTINMQVVENVIHDPYPNGGQHNVYLGSNTVATTGAVVSRNILYNVKTGGYPNLQFNGRCLGCYFEQNLLYDSDGQEMAFLEGVSSSFIRSNVVFNTGTSGNPPLSLTIANYDSGQCQKSGLPSICPWDQTGNTIENNTFWAGTTAPWGGTLVGPTVEITNNATSGPCGNGGAPPCGNLGGNTYRNNIIVGPGTVNSASLAGYPPVAYAKATPAYWSSDTWVDNIINSLDGSTYVVGFGPSTNYGYYPYNCASLNSMTTGSSGCSTSAPGFVNVSTGFYNSPGSFNFSLSPTSAAVGAGTAAGAPLTDILGNMRANPPSIGAYEGSVVTTTIVSSLSCNPTTLTSGATTTCTVGLSQPAGSGGVTVSLSSAVSALTMPSGVSIAGGTSSATFTATAGTISASQSAVVTATLNNSSLTTSLTLSGPAGAATLSSLSCPATVTSGLTATCKVTLGQTAQSGGVLVALSSNNSMLAVPASVQVASGAASATFTLTGATTSTAQSGTITGTLNGSSQAASVSLVVPSGGGSGWVDLGPQTQIQGSYQNICPPNHFGYSTVQGYIGAGTASDSITYSAGTVGTSVTVHTNVGLNFVSTNVNGVRISQTTNYANYLQGTVTSYSSGTLTFTVTSAGGSGTVSNWTVTPGLPFAVQVPTSIGPITITQMDYSFSDQCYNVIANSNGGTLDTTRNRLLIWGGGHAGSSGNEIYILDLNKTPPVMQRIDNPSIFDSGMTCAVQTNGADMIIDGTNPTKVTSAGHSFTAADHFCQIHITGGAGFTTGFYTILTDSGGAAILDRSAGNVGASGGSWVEIVQQLYPSDGKPIVRHTYNQTVYMPDYDRFWTWEGPSFGGPATRDTWTLDAGTYQWTNETLQPTFNGGGVGCKTSNCRGAGAYDITDMMSSPDGANCNYDTAQARVLCLHGNVGEIDQWTQSDHTWRQLTLNSSFCLGLATGCPQQAPGSVIDPTLHLWAFVGTDNTSTPSLGKLRVFVVDVSPGSTYATQDWSNSFASCGGTNAFPTSTLGAGLNVSWPGLTYDFSMHKVVGYPWDGNTLYVMDLGGQTCSPQVVSAVPAVPPSGYTSSTTEGIFGRFQYVPLLGKYVLYSAVRNDAFTFTASGAMTSISPCDLNQDGVVNYADVQISINQSLGIAACSSASLQQNGTCNVIDVQRVVNASLGAACITGP